MQMIFVPLIVYRYLFSLCDFASSKQTNLVQSLAFNLAAEIKRRAVWITRVVDEAGLITVKHTIEAQWEKFTAVTKLDSRLKRFVLIRIIHVEEVTESIIVVVLTPHVTLLFRDDFSAIFCDKTSLWNFFHRE